MNFPRFFRTSTRIGVIKFDSDCSGKLLTRFGAPVHWCLTSTLTKAAFPEYVEIDEQQAHAILGGVNPMVETTEGAL